MERKYPDSRELLHAIGAALGTSGQTQTFSELVVRGALQVSEQRKFAKWWGGHNRPTLTAVIPMLRAAGMLSGPVSTIMGQIEQLATRLEQDAAAVPLADLEAAESALRRLSEGTLRAAEALADRRNAGGGQA